MRPFDDIIVWKNHVVIDKILLKLVILFIYFIKSCIFSFFFNKLKLYVWQIRFAKSAENLLIYKYSVVAIICLCLFILWNMVYLLIYGKLGLVVGMTKQISDGKKIWSSQVSISIYLPPYHQIWSSQVSISIYLPPYHQIFV